MSGTHDLVCDRIDDARLVDRLIAALGPEALAPLESLTPLASVWRKFREADIAAGGDIIEREGAKLPFEKELAITDRDELGAVFVALPSRSPADAIVRICWAALKMAQAQTDGEGKQQPDCAPNWDEAVFMEAVLDLMAPNVMHKIAIGLNAG